MNSNPQSEPSSVRREASCTLPTSFGDFTMTGYTELANNKDHVALYKGDITAAEPLLLRIHSECLTGDALFSRKCDCGGQLQMALSLIQEAGRGLLIYLRQEGRGIGLINKIKAYHLQDEGLDTVEANLALGLPADARDFRPARDILRDLGIGKIKIMTNNPDKMTALTDAGIDITARIPLIIAPNPRNAAYLQVKKNKLRHLFED